MIEAQSMCTRITKIDLINTVLRLSILNDDIANP